MTKPLTESDLVEIEARCEAATCGPWAVIESRDVYSAVIAPSRATICMDCERDANATFIAAARKDVPRLVAEVRRLRGLIVSLVPSTDSEPISKEWLLSVGFMPEDHPQKVTLHRVDAMDIGLWSVDDGWKAMLVYSENGAMCMTRGLQTRGDVLRFAAAMGVELPVKPKEQRGDE